MFVSIKMADAKREPRLATELASILETLIAHHGGGSFRAVRDERVSVEASEKSGFVSRYEVRAVQQLEESNRKLEAMMNAGIQKTDAVEEQSKVRIINDRFFAIDYASSNKLAADRHEATFDFETVLCICNGTRRGRKLKEIEIVFANETIFLAYHSAKILESDKKLLVEHWTKRGRPGWQSSSQLE